MDEEIRYTRSGGIAIAYQVVGEGEIDLVYVPDFVSNLVYGWEIPLWRAFYERLARSFRPRGPVSGKVPWRSLYARRRVS